MKLVRWLCLVLLIMNNANAAETIEPIKLKAEKQTTTYTDALEAYWAFSGIVSAENGEEYNFHFQMQRKEDKFYALATLLDSQSKKVLLFEESSASIKEFVDTNWRVGRAYMQFNPISSSWVFGLAPKDNKGFNFKVDMLGQALSMPLSHGLRSGVEFKINQTGQLNGHLQLGEKPAKDQFVSARKAWFKQIWVSKSQDSPHPLTGVLCQFNDGSGFFSVNLQEPDALTGAIAGWRDDQGTVKPMSQFVSVEEKEDGLWSILISSPKVNLSFENALANESEKHQLIAGLTKGELPGFCTITRDEIGKESEKKSSD